MTSSPVTPVDNENKNMVASLIEWDDELGDLKETTPPVRNQKASPREMTKLNGVKHNKPSSRIRYQLIQKKGFVIKIYLFFQVCR